MDEAREQPQAAGRQRLDKWLFFTRLAKSRALAQKWIGDSLVLVNGRIVSQTSHALRVGDRVEIRSWRGIARHGHTVVVRGAGERRGPYEEARLLYDDLGSRLIDDVPGGP